MRKSPYKYYSLTAIICAFLSLGMKGQNNSRVFQHFNSENGLTQFSVASVIQDKDGYIWIANIDGLNRFDGHSCKAVKDSTKGAKSKSTLHAENLFKDSKGRIWILNANQIKIYDGATNKITTLSDDSIYSKNIGRIDVTALSEDENGIFWIGTRIGLFQFDESKSSYNRFIHDTIGVGNTAYYKNRIRSMLLDGHGTLWIGNISGLVKFSLSTHQFTSVFKTADNPNSNLDDVASMTFDKKGNIWLAITDGGIRVIDTTTNKITYINTKSTNDHLNSNSINKLLCDKNGDIWISHFTKGINIYHPDTKEFESYYHDESDPHSLSDDKTTFLFEDKTGMIWIGTESEGADGVSAVSPHFNTYIQHPGKSNTLCEKGITCVTEDKSGNLWIGSQNGLIYFDRAKNFFTCFHHEEGNTNSLSSENIQAIMMDRNGMLWIGTTMSLNKYNPKTGKWKLYIVNSKIPESFPSPTINGIIERSNGEIWFSSNAGPCKYLPDCDCFETPNNNIAIHRLKPEFYFALFEDSRHTVWISTSRSGVYQLDGDFNVVHWYHVDSKINDGIPSNFINDFAEDKDGNIWMTTNEGLCKLDYKSQKFTSITTKNGLPGNLINQIKIADDGVLWISSCLGLSQVIVDDKSDKVTVKNFNVSDGLQSNVFNLYASLKLHTGELFFGGSKGFNLFKPENIAFNKFIPQVQLSSFMVFDKEFDYLPIYKKLHEIRLDYKQNFFSFDMAAMSFDYPEKNQYAYQLEGFDEEMIYCGTKNHVSYTNVFPGIYTLHIIASNNDGVWNNEGIRIQIEITPPFWMTWWFRITSTIIILIISTLIIRYIFIRRLKKRLAAIEQQREIEGIRSRISRDIHDEIGSGLTRITLLSELVKSNFDSENNDAPLVDKIISSSREISSNLSEIIWTVNPEHDNLESMLSYMRNYINKFFEDAQISYIIAFPEDITNDYIHPDIKRNLFLILKESLTNIIKHSLAKTVMITFSISDKNYKLIIADDGIGIDETKKDEFGNGLRNIQSRAKTINAACSIQSDYGKGTTISIEGMLHDWV